MGVNRPIFALFNNDTWAVHHPNISLFVALILSENWNFWDFFVTQEIILSIKYNTKSVLNNMESEFLSECKKSSFEKVS